MVLKRESGATVKTKGKRVTIDDEIEVAQHVVGQRLVGRRNHGLTAGHQVEHAAVGLHARDLDAASRSAAPGLGSITICTPRISVSGTERWRAMVSGLEPAS